MTLIAETLPAELTFDYQKDGKVSTYKLVLEEGSSLFDDKAFISGHTENGYRRFSKEKILGFWA